MPRTEDDFCSRTGLCQEISGSVDNDFTLTYQGQPESRIICRSSNFTLMADLSPLSVGHLLLVPDAHYLSFGQVLNDHLTETQQILRSIFGQYVETFGDPVVFEHGSSMSMEGSACITHAHLHFLPLHWEDVHGVMVRDGLPSFRINGIEGLKELGNRGDPYFYCGGKDNHRVYGVARTMRRQYLRSVAGELLGISDPEWDYAVVVRKELLRATVAKTDGWTMASN